MTLVAVDAVVDVPADTLMLLISICFSVAVGTGKHCVIVWIGVARRAHAISVSVIDREVGVIPVGRNPRGGVMASRAGRRESRRRVVRVGGACVISLVARIAGRRQGGVVVIDVATGTGNGHVRTRQRECRVVVIEAGRNPRRRVMAHIALLRESNRHVIRIRGALEILQVTAHACSAGEVIVVVNVARGARSRRMRSRQRETGSSMIERRRLPRRRAMANFASLRESLLRVVRIGGALIILQVTRHAGLDRQGELPARMALAAWQRRMCAG